MLADAIVRDRQRVTGWFFDDGAAFLMGTEPKHHRLRWKNFNGKLLREKLADKERSWRLSTSWVDGVNSCGKFGREAIVGQIERRSWADGASRVGYFAVFVNRGLLAGLDGLDEGGSLHHRTFL